MGAPGNPDNVGWYGLGPGMGVDGNVIMAGHVDWANKWRVFHLLDKLNPGTDDIGVWDQRGREHRFLVDAVYRFNVYEMPMREIFAQNGSKLTLITCGGRFDRTSGQYLDRIVAVARAI